MRQSNPSLGGLRPASRDDMETVLSWRNAPSVRMASYNQEEIDLETHRAWWAQMAKDSAFEMHIFNLAGKDLGVVQFSDIHEGDRRASWAFYASPDAPRGTGKLMEFAAIEYAFYNLKISKLHCEVLSTNTPVIGLHESFGFLREGHLLAHRRIGKEMVSVVLMALFRDTWEKLRKNKEKLLILNMRGDNDC